MMIWVVIWKWFLLVGVALFAGMAVIVSIGGALDIRRLFRRLREKQSPDA